MNFFELKGKKLLKIEQQSKRVIVETDSAKVRILHHQECCECVSVDSIEVCPKSLGEEIIEASEEFLAAIDEEPNPRTVESCTWSVYKIHTKSGMSIIRFFGESNGYYGETTCVEEVI